MDTFQILKAAPGNDGDLLGKLADGGHADGSGAIVRAIGEPRSCSGGSRGRTSLRVALLAGDHLRLDRDQHQREQSEGDRPVEADRKAGIDKRHS